MGTILYKWRAAGSKTWAYDIVTIRTADAPDLDKVRTALSKRHGSQYLVLVAVYEPAPIIELD